MSREHSRTRKPAGPGHRTRRSRTPARTESGTLDQLPLLGASGDVPTVRVPRPRKALGFTRRSLVLFAVLAVLSLSFVGSLRVYMTQQRDLATAQQQVLTRTAKVSDLDSELARWRDPAYVKAQARTRLGWVMPGEVGYRVIGLDGTILSGDSEIEGIGTHIGSELDPRWWDRLAGSIKAADDPNPVQP